MQREQRQSERRQAERERERESEGGAGGKFQAWKAFGDCSNHKGPKEKH